MNIPPGDEHVWRGRGKAQNADSLRHQERHRRRVSSQPETIEFHRVSDLREWLICCGELLAEELPVLDEEFIATARQVLMATWLSDEPEPSPHEVLMLVLFAESLEGSVDDVEVALHRLLLLLSLPEMLRREIYYNLETGEYHCSEWLQKLRTMARVTRDNVTTTWQPDE